MNSNDPEVRIYEALVALLPTFRGTIVGISDEL